MDSYRRKEAEIWKQTEIRAFDHQNISQSKKRSDGKARRVGGHKGRKPALTRK